MAPFPEEVDVFTGPHWRMKQLVGLYCDKLSKTNFSNNNDFRSFLQSLCATFKEFKMHEQIENEYIIGLLQQRSQTVYNVHSDNKLSEMLSLFEKGLKNVKNEYEQLNYAQQLKEKLEAFTQDFLPHMKEEEEVFQPMLMEYFTYDELKDIKKKVIAQHCTQRRCDTVEFLKGLSLWNQAEELHKAFKYSVHEKADEGFEKDTKSTHISHLPPEVLLKVFRYLSPEDLCHCSLVCSAWSEVAKTGSLWKHLYPVRWARGDNYKGPPGDLDQEPDDEWVKSREDEGKAYQEWDEDADIDETEEGFKDSPAITVVQREKSLLYGMIQHLLPVVGSSVKSVVLAYSSAVSSKMVRQILSLCPNLMHLDLTQTDITDSAFDSWSSLGSCKTLEHLDLSGCDKITDMMLKKLSQGLGDLTTPDENEGKGGLSKKCRKILKGQQPISLQPSLECGLPVRSHQALIFKRKPGGQATVPSQVWVLDPVNLVDIEDAAEWKQKSNEGLGFGMKDLESPPSNNSCCCRRSKFGFRTSAYWQQYATSAAEVRCGHSFCCNEKALRTIGPLPEPPALCNAVLRTRPSEDKDLVCSRSEKRTDQPEACRTLRFLSLSGCYQITDLGLRVLSLRGGLPHLEHLNLSGCLRITEVGLQELVSACPSLNDEHFYYCDNINGPHADTASGCQNLQCGFRACCRSGE
ncbi:F-box/LRR-repeat protein 5 [Amia ocellicauda]|uniref:F-box/LRR-repeat protein 5 n=1 Tax=Amia ocellicauda TaxID=2972642 RepID=UPI0034649843|nr:FBXL5 protein [Amia calva]